MHRRSLRLLAISIGLITIAAACHEKPSSFVSGVPGRAEAPTLAVGEFVTGLSRPWDIAFAPDQTMIFTERTGTTKVRKTNGTVSRVSMAQADLRVNGETGLMGLAIDPDFASNRRFYTCQGENGPFIQVIAWTMAADYSSAVRANDPLVGGMPAISSGRHGGCRLRVAADGRLIIGTGDAAIGSTPQNLQSLGGKILRVDRFTGAGVAGNPFFGSANANTRRILSYGHRNVQGIAIRPTDHAIWSAEHGPSRDDEVNRVLPGNAGWNPVPGYNEQVPMTDPGLPNTYPARWSTGAPTLALSGATFLNGLQWKSWDGALAVTTLKNASLEVLFFDHLDNFTGKVSRFEGAYGRMRVPVQGPDGSLYIAIDSGASGRILRVTPS